MTRKPQMKMENNECLRWNSLKVPNRNGIYKYIMGDTKRLHPV